MAPQGAQNHVNIIGFPDADSCVCQSWQSAQSIWGESNKEHHGYVTQQSRANCPAMSHNLIVLSLNASARHCGTISGWNYNMMQCIAFFFWKMKKTVPLTWRDLWVVRHAERWVYGYQHARLLTDQSSAIDAQVNACWLYAPRDKRDS